MTQPKNQQVVVAYDFSTSSDEALSRAVDVACRAPHHILHVIAVADPHKGLTIEPTSKVDYDYAERMQEKVSDRVKATFAGRDATTEVHFFVHVRIGKATEEILSLADEVGADLVFIGSHGRTGLGRLLLGSVSEHVVRAARCPVMVVRAKKYDDVELEPVQQVERSAHRYARPHRYSYVDQRVITRSNDWPL